MERITVSALNGLIKHIIDNSALLGTFYVTGEVSNYRPNHTGHVYFSLKDENSLLRCVMFKSYVAKNRFELKNGMQVIVKGSVSVYEKTGEYQLYVTAMEQDGLGALYAAFEETKAKLAKEGLFDESKKRPLPYLPKCVGVLTSETGSVIRDIISVATRRFPNANILVRPIAVQGESCATTAIEGLKQLVHMHMEKGVPDVILIARGGGSFEDLNGFNDEILARYIAASPVPVVSAIGHETDFTIADFVSDLRAPTPSAAAELLFVDEAGERGRLAQMRAALARGPAARLRAERIRLDAAKSKAIFQRPYERLLQERRSLELLKNRACTRLAHIAEIRRMQLSAAASKLDALSPLKILAGGYGITTDEKGKILTSVKEVEVGDKVNIRLSEGSLDCTVDKIILDTE